MAINLDLSKEPYFSDYMEYFKNYDAGKYKPDYDDILRYLAYVVPQMGLVNDTTTNQSVDLLAQYSVDVLTDFAKNINLQHSQFKPGEFKDLNQFLATLGKPHYFNTNLRYFIEIYASLAETHAFYDGNKRTSFTLFYWLIQELSLDYRISTSKWMFIVDAHLALLDKIILKEDFIQIIYHIFLQAEEVSHD